MAKFYISYVRYGDSYAIIVEVLSMEEAERYFLHQKSDAKICNIRLATPEDEKLGMPVAVVEKETPAENENKLNSIAARMILAAFSLS